MPQSDRVKRLRAVEKTGVVFTRALRDLRILEGKFREKMIAKERLEQEVNEIQRDADSLEVIVCDAASLIAEAFCGKNPDADQ